MKWFAVLTELNENAEIVDSKASYHREVKSGALMRALTKIDGKVVCHSAGYGAGLRDHASEIAKMKNGVLVECHGEMGDGFQAAHILDGIKQGAILENHLNG